MHITKVITKGGTEYSGAIRTWRPAFNWFMLYWNDKKFSFSECESIITPDQRVSVLSPPEGEVVDEMLKAHVDLEYGRKNGWTETDEDGNQQPYPKEKWDWEEKYENKGGKNV